MYTRTDRRPRVRILSKISIHMKSRINIFTYNIRRDTKPTLTHLKVQFGDIGLRIEVERNLL